MQPYQKADREIRRKGEQPHELGKFGAGLATGLVGGALASKVLPFLSKYIPQSLVVKGLSKIDPRFGAFINTALDEGESMENIKSFIGDKLGQSEESASKSNETNIVQKYSPELDRLIKEEIGKGRSPTSAAALFPSESKFKKLIKKIEEDNGASWLDIVNSIYGSPNEKKTPNQDLPVIKVPPDRTNRDAVRQEVAQSPQNSAPQQGPGSQALMDILQKIQQLKGS